MKEAWLIRTEEGTQGTFGHLICRQKHWHTGELPWRDNQENISRIPAGMYLCKYRPNGKHGECYELQEVPDRTVVQVHIGNWCGDESLGWKSDVLGCIILGLGRDRLIPPTYKYEQEAVNGSGKAIEQFLKFMVQEDFILHIEDKFQQEA
jgi:hypothetical protein